MEKQQFLDYNKNIICVAQGCYFSGFKDKEKKLILLLSASAKHINNCSLKKPQKNQNGTH